MIFTPLLHAQTNWNASELAAMVQTVSQTDPVAVSDLPLVGMFYSALNPTNPPAPANFNSLPAWDLGSGNYLLDDLDSAGQSLYGMRAMDSGPPAPGDGGSGGDGSTNSFSYTFDTNGLWLELTGITNEIVSLNLNNATDQVYEVWSTVSLTNAAWDIEQEVWPTNQTSMPFIVPMGGRTNGLFFYARDWTGITENGNSIPEWWFWYYFQDAALSDTNLDAYGNPLLYDYQNSLAPTFVALAPSVTQGYAPLTVNFTLNVAGLPGTVESVAWDWQGDEIPDLTTTNLAAQSYTYSAGTYFPVVTITTSQGTFSSGGGIAVNTTNMLANPLTILADANPQIVWSVNVTQPDAVKANADGSVYVLTMFPSTLLLYNSNGTVLRSAALSTNESSFALGFDADASGNVYIPMFSDNQVIKLKPDSGTGYTVDTSFNNVGYIGNSNMTSGNGDYQFDGPTDAAVSADGTAVYVADSWNGRVQKFSASGAFLLSIQGFVEPEGVTADNTGRLFVADPGQWGVFSVVNDSIFDYFADEGAYKVSSDSMVLYDANAYNGVQQFDSYSYTYLRSVPDSVGLNTPYYVSIWPSMVEQRVYIADYYNNRVIGVKFPPQSDPLAAWNAMTQAVANNNLTLALSYFSMFTSAQYNAEFQVIGLANATTLFNQLPSPTLIDMTDSFASYTVIVTLNGVPITFYINFANENGIWKIDTF